MRQATSISAVVFDLGSTLVRETGFHPEEAQRFILSRALSPHNLRQKELEKFNDSVFRDMLERRELSGLEFQLTQYLNLLQTCLGIRLDGDLDEIACRCWFLEHSPRLEGGATECLRQLRSSGVKLGLLSNTILSRKSIKLAMKEFGILDFFDAVVCSSEVAYRKPNSLIYRAILALLRAEATQSAMVGDNLESDIAGAASVGMTTVWYNPGNLPSLETRPDHIVSDLASVPGVLGLC
ncbi:HAD family hydrolase [bacterium]|nr:HAD family hydrolase [bacterium]